MKRIIYFGACLLVLSTAVLSCKKHTTNPAALNVQNEASNIEAPIQFHSDGEKLIFATSNDFDRFIAPDEQEAAEADVENRELTLTPSRDIEAELAEQNYVSYNEYIEENNLDNLIGEEMLSEILNADQIVQIGDFIYRLNMVNAKVFVLSVDYLSDYADLVAENDRNSNIMVYSIEESVIEMVENGEASERGIFCSDRHANEKTTSTLNAVINPSAYFNATSRYQKYGLLHKLEADLYLYDSNSQSDLDVYVSYENCSYQKRCGSSLSNYNATWVVPSAMQITSLVTQYRATLYSSIHELKNYTHKIRGRVNDWDNPVAPNPYKVTVTPWATIEDY
jgi:hypothetical protein